MSLISKQELLMLRSDVIESKDLAKIVFET